MTKIIKIFTLTFLFVSCERSVDNENLIIKNSDSSKKVPSVIIQESDKVVDKPLDRPIAVSVDTNELKSFWTSVVLPILSRERKTVILNMDFPVNGDWTSMMQLEKKSSEATAVDFEQVYAKFFNADLLKLLSKQTYSDVEVSSYRDTIWYSLGFNRSYGEFEGGLILEYFKKGKEYKLKAVYGAGADFYDMK